MPTEPSAKDVAYAHVKGQIASGDIAPGSFLTESQIAGEVGVSRTPVREALHLLEQSGFVQIIPKKGVYVPHMTPDEVEDIWEARRLVETFAVSKIAGKVSDTTWEQVDRLLDAQAEDAAEGRAPQFIENDRAFHQLIVRVASNALITGFYESLRDRQLRMGAQAVLVTPTRYEEAVAEHRAICDALRQGDEARAAEAVREHLDATRAATSPWGG